MGEASRQGVRSQQRTVPELQSPDENIQESFLQKIASKIIVILRALNYAGYEYTTHNPLTFAQLEEREGCRSPRLCSTSISRN